MHTISAQVISYNAAISACEKAGRHDVVFQLLEQMRGRAVHPDLISYNAAISACAKSGKLDLAMQLLAQIPKSNLTPDVDLPSWQLILEE